MDYQPMENNMVKMQTEERIPLKSVFAQDKKEDENKEALASLDDPEEVRKAIIYTEIINRKYWFLIFYDQNGSFRPFYFLYKEIVITFAYNKKRKGSLDLFRDSFCF